MGSLQDFLASYGKSTLLIVALTVIFFGPRLLTHYSQSQNFTLARFAQQCAEDAEPYLLTCGCQDLMSNAQEITPMLATAFVVVSVAVLVPFGFKFILTWLKKPHPVTPQHPLLMSSLYSRLRKRRNSRLRGHNARKRLHFGILSGGRYGTGR